MNSKIMVSVTLIAIMAVLNATGATCFVKSTCLKSISKCNLRETKPDYFSYSARLERSWLLSFSWHQEVECLNPYGGVTLTSQSGENSMSDFASLQIQDLRVPTSIKDVKEEDIEEVNRQALEDCEAAKEELLSTYRMCK